MDRKFLEKTWAEVERNTRNMPDQKVYQKVKQWVLDVRGKIVGEKRRPVHRQVPISWMSDSEVEQMAMVNSVETENVLVVEIPLRELESMAETQDWYQRNIGGYSMAKFDHYIREQHIEKSLRKQHPGLQDLWEKYQEMLILCDDKTFK